MTEETVYIISDTDIEELLSIEMVLDALEEAFHDLGEGDAVYRPRTRTRLTTSNPEHIYHFNTLGGGGSRLGIYCLRLTSGVWRFRDVDGSMRREKLKTDRNGKYFDGMVMLFDIEDGRLLATMPNFAVSRRRVSGVSALAARHLARKDAHRLGIIGTGAHARGHALFFSQIRDIRQIKVYSPNQAHCRNFKAALAEMVAAEVEIVNSAQAAAADVDILVTATNSTVPVYKAEWIQPGTHVNSINQLEVPPDMNTKSDVVVVMGNRKGTYYGSAKVGNTPEQKWRNIDWDGLPDLADLVTHKIAGRTDGRQITFFRNNEGLGLTFAAIGARAYRLAKEKGMGRQVPLDWFLATRRSELFGRSYQTVALDKSA